jgi:hypothetical protein
MNPEQHSMKKTWQALFESIDKEKGFAKVNQ